jgi:acetyl/propionyl-CoA carboxylase alpha subunit
VSLRKDAAVADRWDGPPFQRVLVANRGEIALRVMRACRELGIATVAVYSDADLGTRHVRAADRSIRIGPAPAAESYLRVDAIIEAAIATGADAIHPGYGFLSERPALAEACIAAGITFVGPEPATLLGLGDKLHARRAATSVGVPVVPGTLEPAAVDRADTVEAIVDEAQAIGFPLLVKAAAGGGGRGMRAVDRPEELPAALASASHEALAAFGDGSVYLERRIDGARHVEVQLLGDAHGAIVALGERECSIQRRHQKLVEEAPAPGLDPDFRRRLHEMAVAVAQAVGLRNAATAEFLVAPSGEAWFLEVNARLQVEHGVTELVTGLDLVHEQLWIAAGRSLRDGVMRVAADAAQPAYHAIEVRISAEDPGRSFGPVPGWIGRWRVPTGEGVRMDDWVEEGSRVGSDYDPLLGKLLVVDADRSLAIARMTRALDELEVTGLQTTMPFDRWLMADPDFVAGELSTEFVDRRWHPGPLRDAAAGLAAEAAVRAFVADLETRTTTAGSTRAAGGRQDLDDGWRATGRREAVERWPR